MTDRLMDVPVYLLIAGALQLLLCVPLLLLVRVVGRVRGLRLRQFAARLALFNMVLLFVGCAANSLWMALVYQRWYVSADTVVDFLPFVPFGRWVLDQEFGEFRGRLLGSASLHRLQWAWLALSILTWGIAVVAYRRLVPRLHPYTG
jgi:hypothetical protein